MTAYQVPVEIGCNEYRRIATADFVMTEMQYAAGRCLEEHFHPMHCFSIVASGMMRKTFGRREYDLAASTLVTIPAGESHLDRFGRGGTQMIAVEIVPDNGRIPQAFEPCANLLETVIEHRSERLTKISRQLAGELRHPDDVSQLAASGLVLDLFASTARSQHSRAGPGRPPGWLLRAQEYLHVYSKRVISIDEVARAVDKHPAYLTRVFREHFGQPLGAYARRIRLESAAGDLITSDRPILDIALEYGFSDQSHFTRLFRHQFGTTPARYRAAYQGR